MRRSNACRAETQISNWRQKARPIRPGAPYPAKDYCSQCGLCDTHYVAKVKEACAFLGKGTYPIDDSSSGREGCRDVSRGRSRSRCARSAAVGVPCCVIRRDACVMCSDIQDEDELRFGVQRQILYAKNRPPVDGAQWTGIVTQVALEMLRSKTVEAVVCVQSDDNDRFAPRPVVAFAEDDVLKARGVKPTLSPNLNVLATVEALNLKSLLFIGVGCQVRRTRRIMPDSMSSSRCKRCVRWSTSWVWRSSM